MHSEAGLIWNNQPEEAMKVDAIVIFKRHLDSVYGQEGFRANGTSPVCQLNRLGKVGRRACICIIQVYDYEPNPLLAAKKQ